MARIRTIKPEYWQDEKLSPLPALDRLVFLGLISQADDAGRIVDTPRLLDGLLFPQTDETCGASLEALARAGVIDRGMTASGQRIIQIVGWAKHQRVDHPNLKGALPPIVSGDSRGSREPVATDSRTIPTTYDQRPTTSEDDQRSLGAPDKPAPKRKKGWKFVPDDWQPTERHTELARSLDVSMSRELVKFRDHEFKDPKTDADRAFSRWLRTAAEMGRKPPNGSQAAAVSNEKPQENGQRVGRMTSTDGRDPEVERLERERQEYEQIVAWEREHPADLVSIREDVARSMGAESWAAIDVFNRLLATGKVKAHIRQILDNRGAA